MCNEFPFVDLTEARIHQIRYKSNKLHCCYFSTMREAKKMIKTLEFFDRNEGRFEENKYEIVVL